MTTVKAVTGVDLAVLAVAALTAEWGEKEPGYCQRFAREVDERAGGEPKRIMDNLRVGTAFGTLKNFRERGKQYIVWERPSGLPMPPLQEGDHLYKDDADANFKDGHVGIVAKAKRVRVQQNKAVVCENSHYHVTHPNSPGENANISGGKGWRSLAAFGTFTTIVRLT